MNNFTTEYFTATTDEAERQYFSGEVSPAPCPVGPPPGVLQPGTYRVIDGKLCRIVTGLPLDVVRNRLAAMLQEDRAPTASLLRAGKRYQELIGWPRL